MCVAVQVMLAPGASCVSGQLIEPGSAFGSLIEILEIVTGKTEDGSNIYEVAPAETVIINNPGQLKTLREGAQGKINSDDYKDGQKASAEKVVAAGNILADGAVAPAELTGVTATASEYTTKGLLKVLDDYRKEIERS